MNAALAMGVTTWTAGVLTHARCKHHHVSSLGPVAQLAMHFVDADDGYRTVETVSSSGFLSGCSNEELSLNCVTSAATQDRRHR